MQLKPQLLDGLKAHMSDAEIAQLLSENPGHRDEAAPSFVRSDLAKAATRLGFELPPTYIEFVLQGGLSDLRFANRILEPAEIIAQQSLVHSHDLLPVAANGTGDLFCVAVSSGSSDAVLLWHHDTDSCTPAYESLLAALRAWRF